MLKKTFIVLFLLTFLTPVYTNPVQAEPLQFVSTENAFGYTVNTGLTYGDYWLDISSTGTPVSFSTSPSSPTSQLDDAFSTALALGFDFPFFENTYTEIFVSTNGYLTFENYGSEIYSYNSPIPSDFAPNDIIAPFWDDFFVSTAVGDPTEWAIYYQGDTSEIRIQWEEVIKGGEQNSDKNTFQIILKNNGDIFFVYETLLGTLNQSTVGIEDVDGIDGVGYLYNEDSLSSNSVIGFTYPGPGVHLKLKPLYQSGFLTLNQKVFDFTLVNTGSVDSRFNLQDFYIGGSDWPVEFLNESLVPFTDTNSDSIVDTGVLTAKASIPIKVRVTSPESANSGDYSQLMLRATSVVDGNRKFEVNIQVAHAAPFLQGLSDNTTGVISQVTTSDRMFDQEVNPFFTGATLSLAAVDTQRYIFAWENLGELAGYKTIQFAMFNSTTTTTPSILEVDDTSDDPGVVWDSAPAIAAKYGDRIAIIYARDTYSEFFTKLDSDAFFVLLNQSGGSVVSPTNLSGNNDPNITMEAPSVAVNSTGNVFLTWGKRNRISQSEIYNDLMVAVYNRDGGVVKSSAAITDTQGSSATVRYYAPNVIALSNGQFLLTYYVFDLNAQVFTIHYQLFDGNGNVVLGEQSLADSSGYGQDVIQLTGGKIVITWTNTDTNRIAYAILNADGSVNKTSTDLPSPDNRQMGLVSATYDEFGRGILTWGDEEWSDYLYYALLDENGNITTPPMRFRKGADSANPTIFSSYTGQGNAPIIGDLLWPVYLPLLNR